MSNIYTKFCSRYDYDKDTRSCIESTVQSLLHTNTTEQSPGLLLGKIQSGKTHAFIGIVGLAFDKGYDLAVILTKGTKALATQTCKRFDRAFDEFIEEDQVRIYDVMRIPNELTPYMQSRKLIVIAKKQKDNLSNLVELFRKYEEFKNKQILIVDDEADYASIGFSKTKSQQNENSISVRALAQKINELRSCCTKTSFLQVTATPYCLYLQPKNMEVDGEEYYPIRPAFTQIAPIHDKYIGSDFYFEESAKSDSPASYLHIEVPEKELQILGKPDQRYLNSILKTSNLKIFRFAILNFLVGGVIRRFSESSKNYKCSCVIHTQISLENHDWQYNLVNSLVKNLKVAAQKGDSVVKDLVEECYANLKTSIKINQMPDFQVALQLVQKALLDGEIGINKINSDGAVDSLLDDRTGQLRLDNPFNIFIGGQILDRGITVENLICFFYGRNPNKYQQDTVSQHSRMYGARSKDNIEVTRFYTTANIYIVMKKIHELDAALFADLKDGRYGKDGTVFLEKEDSGTIRPCSPNKILISSIETIKPYKRLLPYGMQTVTREKMNRICHQINLILERYDFVDDKPILIECKDAIKILSLIETSYVFTENFNNIPYKWDIDLHKAIILKLSQEPFDTNNISKLYCFLRRNRDTSRFKSVQSPLPLFSDAPDDGKSDLPLARQYAENLPVLQLFYQNGKKDKGWMGVPFWWPVVVCPKNTKTMIFSKSETKK